VNANKRGITLDLTAPAGIEAFERLLRSADVLVENYTPRVMEQLGLAWERVHACNPSLVMVRMPAFGLDGPWRDRTGFAQTIESITGMASITGFADGPPVPVGGACDPVAGMHAVIATLLALEERDRQGEGMLVEAAMVEAALNIAAEVVVEASANSNVLRRRGNRDDSAAPQGVYRCAGEDSWIAVAVTSDAAWAALRDLLGAPAWACAVDLDSHAGRVSNHDMLDVALAAAFADRDPDELAASLRAVGVAAEVVIPATHIVENQQLRHRCVFEVENHPNTGDCKLPMLPFRFASVDRWLRRAAPTLGEHTNEVLHEHGLDDVRISALYTAGVTGTRPVGA
jgi:crotonobetainyl-CoA:carnitine CoA-transferase CaiB-like acyl-CoA transferase